MTEPADLAQYLNSRLVARSPYGWMYGLYGVSLPSVEVLAQEFLDDAEFQALRLGDWLNSPDGELISAAVGMVIPSLYAREYRLLVDALTIAAREQHRIGQRKAGALAVIGLLAVLALFGGGSSAPALRPA